MNIHFPGLVKKFDDVKSGEAFFCASREGCHFAVKSQELNCAVTVGYPNRASPPRFYDLDAFLGNFADRVLTIADLKIVPSTSMEDVQTMLIRLAPKHTIGSLAAETRCRHARRCLAPRGSALSGLTARVPTPVS